MTNGANPPEPRNVGSFSEVGEGESITVGTDDPWVLGFVREVHVVSDAYIVYTTQAGRVVYAAEEVYDGHNAFQAGFQEIQALPTPTLTADERAQVRSLLGSAMGAALDGEFEVAYEGLESARRFASTQAEKHARMLYLFGALLAATIAAVVGGVGLGSRGPAERIPYDLLTLALLAAIGGALGGLLSIGRRQRGPARFDPLATSRTCLASGAMRVVYAAVSSFLVLSATHVGLVTTGLVEGLDPLKMLVAKVLIASAGGYLENWATNVLGLVGGQDAGDGPAGGDGKSGGGERADGQQDGEQEVPG